MSQAVTKGLTVMIGALVVGLAGCAIPGPAVPPLPLPLPGAVPSVVAVVAPGPPPMTLPRFLGLDVLGRGVVAGVCHVHLKLARHWPALQPGVSSAPRAIGDPANLQSASPAVATAAAAQQAAADAPAKIAALGYLAKLGCSRQPGAEEAFLAGLDDVSEDVRAAAARAIAESQKTPGSLGCKCQCSGSCKGCCTPAIRSKLSFLAYEKDPQGCYWEPSPKVRRLCRLALADCGGACVQECRECEELPPPTSIRAIQVSTAAAS